MPEYRSYVLGKDGLVAGCERIICRDDGEAVAKALHQLDGHDVELWRGKRFIVKVVRPKSASNKD